MSFFLCYASVDLSSYYPIYLLFVCCVLPSILCVIRSALFLSKFITVNVNKKIQLDATVRRYLFTAKSLYMFRASQRPSSGVLKTVTTTSGIGHNTGADTSFRRGLIRISVRESCGMC
jgi:hypothetical protein